METQTDRPRLTLTAEHEALSELYARRHVYLNPAVARRVIEHAERRALKRVRGVGKLKRARVTREDIGAAFAEVCGK